MRSLCVIGVVGLFATACYDFQKAHADCIEQRRCSDDPRLDASTPFDGGHTADGGVDAGTWCSRNSPGGTALCFDYDEPDAGFLNPHTECEISGNGCTATFTIHGATGTPPNLVVAAIPHLGLYPDYSIAEDRYEWPVPAQTATIAFDVRAQDTFGIILDGLAMGPVGYSIAYGGYDPTTFANVNYPDGNLIVDAADYLDDGGMLAHRYFVPYGDGGFIDPTQWHRFALSVSITNDEVILYADGVKVLDDNLYGLPVTSDVLLRWGIGYVDGPFTEATTWNFDNVVLNATTP